MGHLGTLTDAARRAAAHTRRYCKSRFGVVLLGLALTGCAAVQPPIVLEECRQAPAGMLGWWPGDGNANDIINGNPGTLNGGADFAAGKFGDAFIFGGGSDYVSMPSTYLFNRGHDFTIDAWVSLHEPPVIWSQILDTRAGTYWGYGLYIDLNGGIVRFGGRCDNQDNTFGVNSTSAILPGGGWHHVAVVIDWALDESRMYIDGNLENVGDLAACNGLTGSNKFFVGNIGNLNSDHAFNGRIDEFEIFKRVLTASEIASIYKYGKCKEPDFGPDLGIVKTHTPPFHYGGTGQFVITVTNNGPVATIEPIIVKDLLPEGMSVPSTPFSAGPWSCVAVPVPVPPGVQQLVKCAYIPVLEPLDSVVLVLEVQVVPISKFPGGSDRVENCASVFLKGAGPDTITINNVGCDLDVIITSQ